MKGFKNVLAYVDGKGVINCDIAVENGVIKEIGTKLDITEPFPYRDGDVVLPGFIDEHTHGAVGYDFADGTEAAVKGTEPEEVKRTPESPVLWQNNGLEI